MSATFGKRMEPAFSNCSIVVAFGVMTNMPSVDLLSDVTLDKIGFRLGGSGALARGIDDLYGTAAGSCVDGLSGDEDGSVVNALDDVARMPSDRSYGKMMDATASKPVDNTLGSFRDLGDGELIGLLLCLEKRLVGVGV
jgi:hypothetical protein